MQLVEHVTERDHWMHVDHGDPLARRLVFRGHGRDPVVVRQNTRVLDRVGDGRQSSEDESGVRLQPVVLSRIIVRSLSILSGASVLWLPFAALTPFAAPLPV